MAGRELTITCPDDRSVAVLMLRGYAQNADGDDVALHRTRIMRNGDKVNIDDLAPIVRSKLEDGDERMVSLFGGGSTSVKPSASDDPKENPQVEQAERARAARQTQAGKG